MFNFWLKEGLFVFDNGERFIVVIVMKNEVCFNKNCGDDGCRYCKVY